MRIAFFAQLGFHEPLLQPVAEELRTREVEGTGAAASGMGTAVLLTRSRREVLRFQPDVLVMASLDRLEYFRHHLPDACVGSMRHGIGGSKRVASRLPDRASARRLDFVCAGEHSALDHFIRTGAEPAATWFTGYPPLDPLFQHAREVAGTGASVQRGSTAGYRTVLYAPTWNLGLSSAPMLGSDLARSIRGTADDIRIVVKPHPVIPRWRPEWMRAWRAAAAREPNLELVEDADADIVPNLLAADLLVTDASSIALSFLALDRPIVWVTSPRATADPAYEPQDLLWRRRDIGDDVTSVAELPRTVAAALDDPDRRGPQRREVAATLFAGWDDGGSTSRVVDRLLELALLPGDQRPHVARSLARPPEPAWRLHDLRVTVRNQGLVRQLLLGRLEEKRLRARERAMQRAARRTAAARTDEPVR